MSLGFLMIYIKVSILHNFLLFFKFIFSLLLTLYSLFITLFIFDFSLFYPCPHLRLPLLNHLKCSGMLHQRGGITQTFLATDRSPETLSPATVCTASQRASQMGFLLYFACVFKTLSVIL